MTKKGIILRASAMLSTIGILVTGVTFATPNISATLTANSLNSSVGLQVNNSASGTSFASTETGFAFGGMLEGADYDSTNLQNFQLKNTAPDHKDQTVTLAVSGGTATNIANPAAVEFQIVDISKGGGPANTTNTTLQALEAGPVALNGVNGPTPNVLAKNGGTDQFSINAKFDSGALSGDTGSLTGFTFTFTGTEQ